jgi:hypothetical protein
MRASLLTAVLAAVLAVSAGGVPRELISQPEWAGATGGYCVVNAFDSAIEFPSIPVPDNPYIPDNYKQEIRDRTRTARARLLAARRLTDRIQSDVDKIVTATNECSSDAVWTRLAALKSAGEGAARDAAQESLANWAPKGSSVVWTSSSAYDQGAAPAPPELRFAGSCRAPEIDAVLFAPEGPGLSPAARAKLDDIARDTSQIVAALRDQKAALDELVRVDEGYRCREILDAFDALVATERGNFFTYREKAIAGAVWNELTWKKAAPDPAGAPPPK